MNRWNLLVLHALVAGTASVAVGCNTEVVAGPLGLESAPLSVVATKDDPAKVVVTWAPPANVTGLTAYVVLRGGTELGRVAATATRYEDATATPGVLLPPENLTASDATEQAGVQLAWTPGASGPAALVPYTVRAVYNTRKGLPSAEALGGRAAPAIDGYELTRDDGATWSPAGAASPFLDKDAPRAPVSIGTPTVTWESPRALMHVVLSGAPTLGDVPTATYRVRARAAAEASEGSAPAAGRRAGGRIDQLTYQWQRSKAATDADYADIPDVTGRKWVDAAAPAGRFFWRATVSSPWAEGVSAGVAADALPFTSIAAGDGATCGIRSDGTLACWGNSYVRTAVPAGSFKSLVVAERHACALRNDDRMLCWGTSFFDQAPAGPSSDTFKSISTWAGSTCGVKTDGHVLCFGNQSEGPPADTFKQVTTAQHTCGIRSDDRLVCWSEDNFYNSGVPAGPTADAYKFVDTTLHGTCAIRMDDKRVCWGTDTNMFPPGPSAASFKTLSVAGQCGVRTDGRLECWGSVPTQYTTPRDAFKTISGAADHWCGLLADGRPSCWGLPLTAENAAPAYPWLGGTKSVTEPSCRLATNGSVSCVGLMAAYILPDALFTGSFTTLAPRVALRSDGTVVSWPNPPPTAAKYKFVTSDRTNTTICGIRTDDKLVCWGNNLQGQGPPGPSADSFKSVSVGDTRTCAIRADDFVVCWGSGFNGTTIGVTAKAVEMGAQGAFCMIQLDDKRVCWRFDGASIEAPSGVSEDTFSSLSLGGDHVGCGIRTDGHMTCWGNTATFPGGIPEDSPYETYKSVRVMYRSICAVRNDDKARCWGAPNAEQPTLDVLPYN